MEVLQIAKQIEQCINAIKDEGKLSRGLVEAKADAIAQYDMHVGVETLKYKDKGMAATLIPSLVKGDCSQYKRDAIVAEEMLKAHFKRLDYLQSQMNALQSINRHLDNTGR